MKKIFFILTLNLVLLLGCKNTIETNFESYFYRSISLDSTSNWEYRRFLDAFIKPNTDNDTTLFYLLDTKNYKFKLYSSAGKVLKTELPANNINFDSKIIDLYIKTLDTIYYLSQEGILYRGNSKKIDQIYFTDSLTNNRFKNTWLCSYSYFNNFNINNNKIGLITSPQIHVKNFNELYSKPYFATFNIRCNKLIFDKSFCKLPERYTINYYAISLPYIYSDSNKVIYMIEDQDILYVEYFNDSIKTKIVNLNSSKFIMNNPYPEKDIGNDMIELKYLLENSRNAFFTFDKYNQVYIRIYTLPIDFVNKNNLVNSIYDKPFIVSIIDTNYKIIKEVEFKTNKYDIARTIISKEGLMLRKLSEKNISYDVYKIK